MSSEKATGLANGGIAAGLRAFCETLLLLSLIKLIKIHMLHCQALTIGILKPVLSHLLIKLIRIRVQVRRELRHITITTTTTSQLICNPK